MKKVLAILVCGVALLGACDSKQDNGEQNTVVENKSVDVENGDNLESVSVSTENKKNVSLWKNIAGEPDKFKEVFASLNETQKYYFCSAFSIGALSVVKPSTASAMVNYFFGMGLVKYQEGMNEANYIAFDFGKNVFRYELVVNYILENKVCENIMIAASEFVNERKYDVETLSDMGRNEVEKTVEFIRK